VHHHQDNVADFGPSGWNDAQKRRLERSESNIGKILAEQWVPRSLWEKCEVVRKDWEFNLAGEIEGMSRRTDSGVGLAENNNGREEEMEADGRM
tara:strand:+ start:26145 stop:26426 length:282 start_codon:yes stop_codon:yes gene_type:complete